MSCNFSDRFFVMNCSLCIFGLLCQRKHLNLTLFRFQGYISDTEDTLSYEGKDVQIFKQIKEKEEEEKQAQEKLAKENQEKLATEKAEKASTGGSHVVDNISNGGASEGTNTNVPTETHAKTEL